MTKFMFSITSQIKGLIAFAQGEGYTVGLWMHDKVIKSFKRSNRQRASKPQVFGAKMNEKRPNNTSDNTRQDLTRKLEERERQRQKSIEMNKRDAIPVVADLAEAGFDVEWVSDLNHQNKSYKNAIPVLLKWLPLIDNLDVKEEIVRALSVPWAKPIAAPALVAEYYKLQCESEIGIKWAIGNALSIVADDSVFMEIVNIVSDRQHGASREMLAVSLGNMKDPRAQDVLIGLLDDEVVAGHAIMALGKLKSIKAYPKIEGFLNHPKAWVRKEARRALEKIDKAKGAN